MNKNQEDKEHQRAKFIELAKEIGERGISGDICGFSREDISNIYTDYFFDVIVDVLVEEQKKLDQGTRSNKFNDIKVKLQALNAERNNKTKKSTPNKVFIIPPTKRKARM